MKKKILVVDDEPQVTQLIKTILVRVGNYAVREAHDGRGALEAARADHPDLVLLDIMMPELDGSQVAQQMRDDKHLCDVPIIFLTGAVTPQEVEENNGVIGGHPYLAKPVTFTALTALINKYIHQRNRNQQ